uniref:Acetyltransferase (GNAT) domain-containing protein n=1 Tax=Candidatus Kentrum sp. FW TaxID=2126338 RepID=A0A450T3S7_9GAMM|nr:MAG: Acetyltransferase (GNAT) domain-containing protein [Candidatus Kentron sp. FW]
MIKVQPLTGDHDRNGFDCGVDILNLWLRKTARQHQARGISRTFVAVPASQEAVALYRANGYGHIEQTAILGYYALASAFVLADDLAPKFAKRYPNRIPVTRLGRLAVRLDLGGQGLGRFLLADAITRSRNAALSVGSAGIFVDAKNDSAAEFYGQYGFSACREDPLKLYLPMW